MGKAGSKAGKFVQATRLRPRKKADGTKKESCSRNKKALV